MKGALVVFLIALVSLSGVAFTMQAFDSPTTSTHVTAPPALINELPINEPVSIVLSSLLLLGTTTLLRRKRTMSPSMKRSEADA